MYGSLIVQALRLYLETGWYADAGGGKGGLRTLCFHIYLTSHARLHLTATMRLNITMVCGMW